MPDIREQLLVQLGVTLQGVSGVAAVARNKLDVPGLARPAVLVQDGSEQFLDRAEGARFSEVQRMELSPQITLKLRADDNEIGAVLTLYRGRVVTAILTDATLRSLVGTTGGIRFEGSNVPEPTPESQEPRMDISIVFTFPFRLSDLAA